MLKRTFANQKFNELLPPAILTLAEWYFLIILDNIFAGRMIGEFGMAAVDVVAPMYTAAEFVAGLVGMGTTYLYCTAIGEFNKERANRLYGQGVILSIVSGIVMFIIMWIIREPFLNFMNLSPNVHELAASFWKGESFVVLISPLTYLAGEIIYADGDNTLKVLQSIISFCGNIVFSIILCNRMGIIGISLGTFISEIISIAIASLHLLRKDNQLKFIWHISFRDIIEMCSLALTDASSYICMSLLSIFLTKIIIHKYTDIYLPVLSVAFAIFELVLILDSIGEALTPIAEMYIGEKNYSAEKELVNHSLIMAFFESGVLIVILLIMAPIIPSIYDITTPVLVSCCEQAVRIMAVSIAIMSISYLITSQALLVRQIAIAVGYQFFSDFLLHLILDPILLSLFGLNGIWWSFSVSHIVSIILYKIFVDVKFGKSYFPWLLPEEEYPILTHSFKTSDKELIDARNKVEHFLKDYAIEPKIVNRAMLIIEECGNSIKSVNNNKAIRCEFAVAILENGISIILRSNGKHFEIVDLNMKVCNLSDYVISNLMVHCDNKLFLRTINFNRSVFMIPMKDDIKNLKHVEK